MEFVMIYFSRFSLRRKSRFDLIRVCCIIVGIEFAYAAETAFVSPTLLEIGINHKVNFIYIFYMITASSTQLSLITANDNGMEFVTTAGILLGTINGIP